MLTGSCLYRFRDLAVVLRSETNQPSEAEARLDII
jgi:hypothetical protein